MSEFFESEVEYMPITPSSKILTNITKIYDMMQNILMPEHPIIYISIEKTGFFTKTIYTVSTISEVFSNDPQSRVYVVACLPGLDLSNILHPDELENMNGPQILYNNSNKTCVTGF